MVQSFRNEIMINENTMNELFMNNVIAMHLEKR
jgi:hypothetical protein